MLLKAELLFRPSANRKRNYEKQQGGGLAIDRPPQVSFGVKVVASSIKVLVVDDSAFMRKVLSGILSDDPQIEVVGTARDGQDALVKIEQLKPDVVTLDVEMPRMDGISALREIMATNPLPVVMLSSLTQSGSRATIEALSLGAVDFVSKPSGSISLDIHKVANDLVRKVKMAATACLSASRPKRSFWRTQVGNPSSFTTSEQKTARMLQSVASLTPRAIDSSARGEAKNLVVIGSSTGGPKALEIVLTSIPADINASLLVVQHMPAGFTRSLAERLNSLCTIVVKEAEENDRLVVGRALVAPGDYHLTIAADRTIRLNKDEPVNFVRPSIDVTMLSAARLFPKTIVGVILTGMGRDGAAGMAAIKQAGGVTLAQDKETSVIYSMPRVVAENGDADYILPVDRIGDAIAKVVKHFG